MKIRSAMTAAAVSALLSLLPLAAPAAMLAVGEKFPDWELRDQTGHPFASSELAGKRYLLWYYPKAMTPGCTKEGRALAAEHGAFEEAGITILGVSFDEPTDNAEFARSELFPFRLLSDIERNLAVAVGAADDDQAAYARRVSYLVGADGKIEKVFDDVDPETHAKDVLDAGS
jgi:peroxiredoxin Q/BCP